MFKGKNQYLIYKDRINEKLNKGTRAVSVYFDKKLNKETILKSQLFKTFEEAKFVTKIIVFLIALLFPLAIILTAINVSKQNQYKKTHATVAPTVSLSPSSVSLPPEATFSLNVNSGGNSLGFIHLELTFNPAKIKLTKEVSLSGVFTRIVRLSSMAEANTSGRIVIILGLDPAQINNVPTGTFLLSNLSFGANTSVSNVTDNINFDQAVTQIVSLDQVTYNSSTVGVAGASLTINPTPTLIPFPSKSPTLIIIPTTTTNTPIITISKAPVPINTIAPTSNPILTATPIPTRNPTRIPKTIN